MSLLAGVTSAFGAGIGSSLVGKLTDTDIKLDGSNGIGSAVAGSGTGVSTADPDVSGSQVDELVQDEMYNKVADSFATSVGSSLEDRVQSGIDSIINPKRNLSGRERGKESRAYLDSMFPELSAWDKAGVNTPDFTGAGAQMKQEEKLLDKQLKSQQEIAKQNNETSERIAGINSATQLEMSGNQIQLERERLPFQIQQMQQNIKESIAREDLTKEQKANAIVEGYGKILANENMYLSNQQKSDLNKKVAYEVEKMETTNSTFGKMFEDLNNVFDDVVGIRPDELLKQHYDNLKGFVPDKLKGIFSFAR